MKKYALCSILCTIMLFSGSWVKAESEDSMPAPIRIVAAFLELTEEQVAELTVLREVLHSEVKPLAEAKKSLKVELATELASDEPSAEYVGELMIEIHVLQGQIAEAYKFYVGSFTAMLEPRQLEKYGAIKMAIKLQRVIPAFEKLGLTGPGSRHPGHRPTRRPTRDPNVERDPSSVERDNTVERDQ